MEADQERSGGRLIQVGLPILLMILSLAIYLPTISTERVVNDSQAAAASAWRIATTGAPWMEGVNASELQGHSDIDWIIETDQGHLVHNRTPGVILSGVPFYWVLNNESAAADFELWVGGAAAATITALAGVMLFLGLRNWMGNTWALGGTSVLLFATPVWSVSADALWTQNLTLLAIGGAVWALVTDRWKVAGAFLAIGIFARPHVAVIAAVVGLYLGWRRRDWHIVARVGVTSALGVAALVIWNRIVFGVWNVRGGYSHEVSDALWGDTGTVGYHVANVYGFLFSPDRGLMVWTPVVLVLLPVTLAFWKQLPDWTQALVWAGVVYSVVQLRINVFHGGQGLYGYRVALELLVCLTPALISAFRVAAPIVRCFVGGLIGAQFAAIAIGAATNDYQVDEVGLFTTNAFLQAMADRPVVFGLLTILSVAAGVVLAVKTQRRSERTPRPTVATSH